MLNPLEKYRKSKRERKIERELPQALYQASNMLAYTSLEETLESLTKQETEVGKEFAKALKEIQNGESVENALKNISERVRTSLVERAVRLLILSYRAGSESSQALQEIAEDTQQTLQARAEQAAASTIEKYTLLIAGALLVPLILGSMISIVNSLDLEAVSYYGFGTQSEDKDLIRANSVLGSQIYTALYALMASFFVAYQEGRKEKTLLYAAILLPSSIAIFNASQNMSLLSLI